MGSSTGPRPRFRLIVEALDPRDAGRRLARCLKLLGRHGFRHLGFDELPPAVIAPQTQAQTPEGAAESPPT